MEKRKTWVIGGQVLRTRAWLIVRLFLRDSANENESGWAVSGMAKAPRSGWLRKNRHAGTRYAAGTRIPRQATRKPWEKACFTRGCAAPASWIGYTGSDHPEGKKHRRSVLPGGRDQTEARNWCCRFRPNAVRDCALESVRQIEDMVWTSSPLPSITGCFSVKTASFITCSLGHQWNKKTVLFLLLYKV